MLRALAMALLSATIVAQDQVLIEAESFAEHGGWMLDTQFVDIMGSPYLLAHGLGEPVADARTTVTLPAAGDWRLWVRTVDWVARWRAPGAPGRFQVVVNGAPLRTTFGTTGATWAWHDGGTVAVAELEVDLALHDLTGFDGRCDAVLLSRDPSFRPPDDDAVLAPWRHRMLGLPEKTLALGPYDLVVVGGGYAGVATAVSASRMGCKVALIQDRAVLGGNGSSEVRVWAKGGTRRGPFPRLGEIVDEFADQAQKSPGRGEEFGDDRKRALVEAEPNLDLFLEHRAHRVAMDGDRVAAVYAFHTRSGADKRFVGRLFADCTGHGSIGVLAGADHDVMRQGHLGMSNMWRWAEAEEPHEFPETPWALDLEMGDFPYPRDHHGQWFWESGFDRHPIDDLEYVRDWNLRAVFGAFGAMKNGRGRKQHENAVLTWVAYVGGTRESRQLLGDVVLTREDVIERRVFADGCVPTTWDIDLHYPKEQYADKYPGDPFISRAEFGAGVDKKNGYPVPYRCFYSRNVPNLFMAGRCISVTHEALGTVRVMKTGGMMGEVIGKAAAICVAEDCTPRQVYADHLGRLQELMRLPGRARRSSVQDDLQVPPAPAMGMLTRGVPATDIPGLVLDNDRAELVGDWISSTHHDGFVGSDYLHDADAGKGEKSARFTVRVQKSGEYRLALSYRHSASRARRVPVVVATRSWRKEVHVDQSQPPSGLHGFAPLGTFTLQAGRPVIVTIGTAGTKGHVIVDALQVVTAQ